MAAVAPVILVSAVTLTGGAASAKKAPAATIACKDLTATISWNPPLTASSTESSKTTQITISSATVSGCTTDPTSSVTDATSVTATATLSKHGNSCAQFKPGAPSTGKPTTYTFDITWQ